MSRYTKASMRERVRGQVTNDDCMVNIAVVSSKTDLSRTTIYDKVARGEFPKPIKLSPRRIAWRASAISAWLIEREAA